MRAAAKITRKSQQFILALNFKENFKNSSQIFCALFTSYSIVVLNLTEVGFCGKLLIVTKRQLEQKQFPA